MLKKLYILALLLCTFTLSACAPNVNSQTNLLNDDTSSISLTPVAINHVGTAADPEEIIIYNRERSTSLKKGTCSFETVKSYIYKMINEKSRNDILQLCIPKGNVSVFKQLLSVEFLYSSPVEFEYPNGSKEMIRKFLVAPAAQSYTVITAPSDTGLYSKGLFMVEMDASYLTELADSVTMRARD